jgi:ribonuclease E
MGVIMRTAGVERSKAEIKRDLDFLLRTWDEVRELTLKSTAPCLVYEEGNLIKRAIRDLYVKEIDEVLVDGNEPYQTAKTFMRLLMPSHAKKVKPYREESMPLFYRFQVEGQLAQMHSPIVQLKSGGYIVISPTEALVAIDVNSGRATRERNIEETATKTNLEAADEIARQLRLRDLAGLIVIDFIDMEEGRNQRAVERRLKEAMKNDRARLQVGRISPFGLLELSRQRLRPSLLEASTEVCPRCRGAGHVRSTESTAIHVLRAIEEEGIRHRSERILVRVPTEVALYILNQKREMLHGIEMRYGFRVDIERDDTLIPPDFRLERVKLRAEGEAAPAAPAVIRFQPTPPPEEEEAEEEEPVAEEEEEAEAEDVAARGEPAPSKGEERPGEEGRGERRRRRRRGRRGAERPGFEPRPREQHVTAADEAQPVEIREDAEAPAEDAHQAAPQEARGDGANGEHKRRRRGRRGGRRRGRHPGEGAAPELHAPSIAAGGEAPSPVETGEAYGVPDDVSGIPEPPAEPWREPVAEARRAQPAPEPEPRAERSEREEHREPVLSSPEPLSRDEAPKPTRRGWWQRVVR